jgi:hypothetical protein
LKSDDFDASDLQTLKAIVLSEAGRGSAAGPNSNTKGTIMSKKMMLLALAVAALFALPSTASAQEIHWSRVTSFSGSGGAGSIAAANEPKISCTGTAMSGSFNAGSSTTGSVSLTFTGCSAEFLGIKGNCNTVGDASGTVTSSAVFHLITTSTSKPGFLLTPATHTYVCVGFSRILFTGNGIIGTITSPACGAKSKTMTLSFKQAGGTQEDLEYTGTKYDLKADTENSAGEISSTTTAGLEGTTTISSSTEGTLECT